MKDIPVFTTQYGVASLVLKQIPYQRSAYITIQDSLEPERLLEECKGFCRACDAQKIYASGHPCLEQYPLLTAMWQMQRDLAGLRDTDAALWPVQRETMEQWRSIYNRKVVTIPNGAWMTEADCRAMLEKGDGYFVHQNGELLGIGRAQGDTIDWVASVRPGAGEDVVCALAHALTSDVIILTVASENKKAVELYERLGFLKTAEIARWFEV